MNHSINWFHLKRGESSPQSQTKAEKRTSDAGLRRGRIYQKVAGGYVRAHRGLVVFVTAILFLFALFTPNPLRPLFLSAAVAETTEKKADEAEIRRLIQALGEDRGWDWDIGHGAVNALVKIGQPAVDQLIKALKNENWRVREKAAEALEKIGWVPANNSDRSLYFVAKGNWEGLVKIGQPAVEPLIEALEAENWVVRRNAAETLGKIGWEPVSKTEESIYYIAKMDWKGVVKIGQPAVGPLIKRLWVWDPVVHDDVVSALIKIGKPAAEGWVKALEDPHKRHFAIDILERIGWEPVSEIEKSVYYIAKADWEGLVKIGQPAVEPLIKELGYLSRDGRPHEVEVLVKIGKPAVDPLIEALGGNPAVHYHAIEALGQIGDPRAVVPLIQALKKRYRFEDPSLTIETGSGIIQLVSPPPDKYLDDATTEALMKISKLTVNPLIQTLGNPDPFVRCYAAKILGNIGDTQAVEPLIRLLEDKDSDVRRHVVEALGKIRDAQSVNSLIQALEDRDKSVRRHAVEALGNIGNVQAVEPLIKTLEDKDWKVREAASKALVKIGKPAVEPLIRTLDDKNWEVRRHAAEMLEKIGWDSTNERERSLYLIAKLDWKMLVMIGKPAVEPLIKLLENKEEKREFRCEAAVALGKIGSVQAVATLIRILEDEDWEVSRNAVIALGEIGGDQAVKPLIEMLDKYREVPHHVVEALVKIGKPAVELLIKVLENKEKDRGLRSAVAEALGQIGNVRAVKPLIKILENRDEDGSVRRSAAEALGQIGGARAVKPLINVLRNKNEDSWLRDQAVEALVKIGKPAVRPLKAIAYNRFKYEEGVKVEARQALQAIQSNVASQEREEITSGRLHWLQSTLKNHAGHLLFASTTAIIGILMVVWVFIAIGWFKHYRANKEARRNE